MSPSPVKPIAPEHLEEAACALCGKGGGAIVFEIRGFPVRRCAACQMLYVSPRLRGAELIEMYSDESYYRSTDSLLHGYGNYLGDRENIIATFRKRLSWVMDATGQKNPGRLLDVGSAMGFGVENALEQGWDAFGIEPSSYASGIASQRLGDRVSQGTLDTHRFPKNSFDTILLWDVIEHVPDPIRTLGQVFDLLKPGGTLSIITPDCGSWVARGMGRFWMEYSKPTEHIYFFSKETMREALTRAGFQPFATATAGKYVAFDFLFERLGGYLPVLKNPLERLRQAKLARQLLYIDPRDKMHLLAAKPQEK